MVAITRLNRPGYTMLITPASATPSILSGNVKNACETAALPNTRSRFFFSSRRRHTTLQGDWSSDVCSSDLSSPQNEPQCGDDDVLLGVEVVRQHAGGIAGLVRDTHHARPVETVLGHHPEIGRASCRERV